MVEEIDYAMRDCTSGSRHKKGKEFGEYVDNWIANKDRFKQIIIFGNGDGLLDAPINLLWDDIFFRIGINRAFFLGHMHTIVHRDSIVELEKHTFNPFNEFGQYEEWERPKIIKSCDSYRDPEEIVRRSYANDSPLGMSKNTLHAALDLATRISQNEIPIILCGVSFDTRWHFYGHRFNKTHSAKNEPFFKNKKAYGEHTLWKTTVSLIKLFKKHGADLYYTDDSRILEQTGIKKISYEDLNTWI